MVKFINNKFYIVIKALGQNKYRVLINGQKSTLTLAKINDLLLEKRRV